MGGPLSSGHPEAAPSCSWLPTRTRRGALPALRVELQARKLLSCHLNLAPQWESPPSPFVCCHSFGCVGQEPQGADWHCGLRLCLDKQHTCHMEKWLLERASQSSALPSFVCVPEPDSAELQSPCALGGLITWFSDSWSCQPRREKENKQVNTQEWLYHNDTRASGNWL